MKYSKLLFFLLYFFSFGFNLFSQSRKIDSLQTIINTSKEDTSKVNALVSLSSEYMFFGDNKKANEFSKEASEISIKIKFLKGQANAIKWSNGHLWCFLKDD